MASKIVETNRDSGSLYCLNMVTESRRRNKVAGPEVVVVGTGTPEVVIDVT